MPHTPTPSQPAANPAAATATTKADTATIRRPPIDQALPAKVQTAVFALGCFWGAEALYGAQPGVVRVRCGYCGGTTANPTYHNLSNYTESVAVDFDPTVISYDRLLDLFWANASPTSRSWSQQYKSAVFTDGAQQQKAALASREKLAQTLNASIPVEVLPATHFYTAEDYHQHYRLRNTKALMNEFAAWYPQAQDFLNSTAAARINGYLSGFGSPEQLAREIDSLGLSPAGQKTLTQIVASHPTEGCALP